MWPMGSQWRRGASLSLTFPSDCVKTSCASCLFIAIAFCRRLFEVVTMKFTISAVPDHHVVAPCLSASVGKGSIFCQVLAIGNSAQSLVSMLGRFIRRGSGPIQSWFAYCLNAVKIWECSSWSSSLSKSQGLYVGLGTCWSVLHCSMELIIRSAIGHGVWYLESITLNSFVAFSHAPWQLLLMHHKTWWVSSFRRPHAKHLLSTKLSIMFKCFFVGAHL